MRHLVLVDHLGLFHLLNSDDLLGLLVSADAHLSEGTPADDFQGLEVADSDLGAREAEQFCLLVLYLLLNQLLLLSRQVHLVHLLQKLIPRYTFITDHDPYLPSSPSPRSSASHTSSLCMPSPPPPSLWSPGSAGRWPPLAASTATGVAVALAATITAAVGLATDAAATAGSEATTIVAVLIAATVRATGQEGLAT